MQYVRSISGSVSKTWNSINPATLSGAIDVIVVENEDGSLACSPFHVRFGKFSLLRPYEKKVEFHVNSTRQDYAMKLGEGGEAFFVFETTSAVPENLRTSPLVSPVTSPEAKPVPLQSTPSTLDLEPLDLAADTIRPVLTQTSTGSSAPIHIAARIGDGDSKSYEDMPFSQSFPENPSASDLAAEWTNKGKLTDAFTAEDVPSRLRPSLQTFQTVPEGSSGRTGQGTDRTGSPPLLAKHEALTRAINLSKKLWNSNVPSTVTDDGDLMLDMTGYKSSEEDSLRAEVVARQILSEELEGNYDIGSLIGADEKGNLWIYSSEEAKEAAARKVTYPMMAPAAMVTSDAASDPGYHSDDNQSQNSLHMGTALQRRESDSAVGLITPPDSPQALEAVEPGRNYAKTLRLTSDQLKALNLKSGPNPMSFSVNRATCQAFIYLWKYNVPIVISDIDGTITKSDALGHVLNMLGRDWTHLGVAKLYSDIVANGYNILYLTSRSTGQADTTRTYINGIVQEGYKLPKGPVIMSPDRTIAALRRELYLRKPEVFKMACLRDIKNLFHQRESPFYAGFGNRLTDALSYRSVNIPSTRIFTINSNAEVSLDLLSLNTYKTGYTSMRETVDHFFPPVTMLVQEGGEEFTDFNYWREAPLNIDQLSASDSDDEPLPRQRTDSEYGESEAGDADDDMLSEDMGDSRYLSHTSMEPSTSNLPVRSMDSVTARESFGGTEEQNIDLELEGTLGNHDVERLDTYVTDRSFSPGALRAGLNELAEALSMTGKEADMVR